MVRSKDKLTACSLKTLLICLIMHAICSKSAGNVVSNTHMHRTVPNVYLQLQEQSAHLDFGADTLYFAHFIANLNGSFGILRPRKSRTSSRLMKRKSNWVDSEKRAKRAKKQENRRN